MRKSQSSLIFGLKSSAYSQESHTVVFGHFNNVNASGGSFKPFRTFIVDPYDQEALGS